MYRASRSAFLRRNGRRYRSTAREASIVLLPGDGIGPEITEQAVHVLETVASSRGHTFRFSTELIGGAAIDASGEGMTDASVNVCKASDAVLLGAVGGPKWDDPDSNVRPEQGLLKIRKEMGLFANLRPILFFDDLLHTSPLRPEIVKGVNILFVRELTGGIYFGPREEYKDGKAHDIMVYHDWEVERIVRVAAEAARKRGGKVLSVDKANVLATSRMWRKVAEKVMKEEYPELALSHGLVDSVAMDIVTRPSTFDVIVTENMFGDILSDEASVLSGSLGLLPSASLSSPGKPGLYEPIHGSAPDIAGQGIANPIGSILSSAMMLRHSLDMEEEAVAVERAVDGALKDGLRTADIGGTTTTAEMGAAVSRHLAALLRGGKRAFSSTPVRHEATGTRPRTLLDKIWDSHVVDQQDDGTCLLYIDRHLVHEVTSPQAFEGLRMNGRAVRRTDLTLATADHNVPTTDRSQGIADPESREQVDALTRNCKEFDVQLFGMDDKRQGIVHIVGPEQGFTLPGTTIVCGDSHTATHGAFGALAFGIGTSEVEHVLATQCLLQVPSKNMRINVDGTLPAGVTSKDLILHIIGEIGMAGGTNHMIEYAGEAVRALSMEGRMTVCNMSIEAGARAGLIAPDETTFTYLQGRPMAPSGTLWDSAVKYWRTLPSDPGAVYDKEVNIPATYIPPQVTWGTTPQDVAPVDGVVPNPADEEDPLRRDAIARALEYMGLTAGQRIEDISIDKVFIGSCTNARIEDLRAVAEVAKGRKVAAGVEALVVPGSGLIKEQAEAEGVAAVLIEAGFSWREPGCSMCLAMNADRLQAGERCASTSNRNFEGRQGRGGRTHLVSPGMAAAAAINGRLSDVRAFGPSTRAFSTSSPARNSSSQFGFVNVKGPAAPLDMVDVDTDMIIPKDFLKTIKRTGLGAHLFNEIRFTDSGAEEPNFVLNNPAYRNAKVLVAGDNFGCGSSREHAPWALLDFGFKCIISTSFADIFYNNCFKNGILPVRLPAEDVRLLMADAEAKQEIEVDLERKVVVRPSGEEIPFDVEEFRRYCLLNGLDDIGLTLKKDAKIAAYERQRFAWL